MTSRAVAPSATAPAGARADGDNEITVLEIEAHIREVAARHGISPLLVAAIVEAESEFNPRAVSRKGARGLMQLMPRTALSYQVEDSSDPFENIEAGVRHLRRLMDRFHGDLPLVLAAYNAGERAVLVYGGVPPYRETRRYVARILRRIGRSDLLTSPSNGTGRMAVPISTQGYVVAMRTLVAVPAVDTDLVELEAIPLELPRLATQNP
jgi:soluble lytic murein transglycosylase-like protein